MQLSDLKADACAVRSDLSRRVNQRAWRGVTARAAGSIAAHRFRSSSPRGYEIWLTGSPAIFHSGYPSSRRRTRKPRCRSMATASNEERTRAAAISDDLHIGGQFGEALLEKRADPGPRRDEG